MAQASYDRDIRGLPVNIGLLGGFVVSLVSAFSIFVGFQHWDDIRNRDAVSVYVNEFVNPRIASLERSVKRQVEINAQVMQMIESQDQSRNRQYGEMKKILESNNEQMKQVIDHLLVNR